MAKVKYTLLLPLNFNDGTAVPRKARNRICDEIFDFADGYGQAGEVTGAYRMRDGSKQVDRSLVIWVGIYSKQKAALKRLVAKFARDTRTGSRIALPRTHRRHHRVRQAASSGE